MKLKYVIIIVIILLIVGGFMCFRKKRNKNVEVEISDIKSFHLSYSKGYMMNANIRYELKYDRESNSYKAIIKPYLIAEEDKLEVDVDESVKDEIKAVLIEYEVGKWNGFNKSDQNVLDGDSFSLSVRFENDIGISASGYMKWPQNYSSVVNKIDNIFMTIYNKYIRSEE